MKTVGGQVWESLRTSLWFVPALLTIAAVALSLGLVQIDRRLAIADIAWLAWVFEGGPEGAAEIMSAIATAIITVAGVVFSVTIVALTLASNQFSPRVLRQFTQDHANQLVLGAFIATFIYSLLVLRSIRAEEGNEFTPYLGVTVGVFLAVVTMAMLIFFIHHIASSIQASTIIHSIARETIHLINNLFPEELGEEHPPSDEDEDEPQPDGMQATIPASDIGYIQTVDEESLLALAEQYDLTLRMERSIGDFTPAGAALIAVWPAQRLSDEAAKKLIRCAGIGRNRTMQQDPEFGISQIVEIAVKALSPSVNDPSTAAACIDHLSGILRHMGNRAIPSRFRRDAEGNIRAIARGMDFTTAVNLAFDEIRRNSEKEVMVTRSLLDAIASIAEAATLPSRREVLRRQAELIASGAERGIADPTDRQEALVHAQKVIAALRDTLDKAA